ncbi:MAG: hypothetical protein DMF70_05980 [Acidobacteria bacterium]|nr:MAG: hypothetical protein DMF70_05980 [Acidobacteriota bacterium]
MPVSRLQVWLTVLVGIFLAGTVVMLAMFALAPNTAAINRPILLTGFIVALFLSLVCIAWLLRGLLRPYSQLVGEARRAPVEHSGTISQQQELQRLTEQASERADSAERFSDRIVASMPTGLIAFDSSGHATLINGPARGLFQTEANTPGEHYRAIFATVPALAEMVETCLATGQLFRREEIESANGSAQTKRLGATVAPIDPADSGARGALCLLTDITEVSRLREQVALKRNLESLGEMSAGLAHEFKNAMAALHGYAQFLQSIDHDERGQAAAAGLLQEVRRLSEMSTAFLNFARPQPLQLEDVSLDELINECARELKPLFEERRVELIVERASSAQPDKRGTNPTVREGPDEQRGTSPTVREGSLTETESIEIQGDARMLRQALLNLVRNAAEAIEEGKTERRVTVNLSTQTERGQPWATISIRDTGHGIPESDLQRIFIPFFTTKSQGHGVGLALAHRVITEHGGTLTVANAADGGALFTIRLPQ